MLHKWYEAMDTPGGLLRICMLNFSKAFDRIDLNILLEKLYGMGIQPVLINWIANFLAGREQRTRVGNHYSNWKKTNAGVPHGTKLGPLLFLIMVNDLSVSDDTVKEAPYSWFSIRHFSYRSGSSQESRVECSRSAEILKNYL